MWSSGVAFQIAVGLSLDCTTCLIARKDMLASSLGGFSLRSVCACR